MKHNLPNLDSIAMKAGGKCTQRVLVVMVFLYLTGLCVGYEIILTQLIAVVLRAAGVDPDFLDSMKFRAYVGIPAAAFCFFPLSLLRDMSSLSYASFVALVALFYTLLVLVVECPFFYQLNHDKPDYESHAFIFDLNLPVAASITFFSFTCQLQLLPIFSELVKPNYTRIKKVVIRALVIDYFFYVIMACAGYFSTFNFTRSIVMDRDDLPGNSPDYWMLVAVVSISSLMFASLPVNYNPWRNQFFMLWKGNTSFSNKE